MVETITRLRNSVKFRIRRIYNLVVIPAKTIYLHIKYINFDPVSESRRIDDKKLSGAIEVNNSTIDCNLLDQTTLITLARSEFYDLLPIYQKFLLNLPGNWTNIFLSNKSTDLRIALDSKTPFKWKLLETLELVTTPYVMLTQLDFLFLPNANVALLEKARILLENQTYGFFRVGYLGVKELNKIDNNFIEIDPDQDYYFSWLPTFYKVDLLKKIIKDTFVFEINHEEDFSRILRRIKVKGFTVASIFRESNVSGCKVLPWINALHGGKWTIYWKDQIEEVLGKENIDFNIRGWS